MAAAEAEEEEEEEDQMGITINEHELLQHRIIFYRFSTRINSDFWHDAPVVEVQGIALVH